MKKNNSFRELFYSSLKKILLIMRFAIIFLALGILQSYAVETYSQKTRLSINFSDAQLINVLDKIEDESEFFFLYNEKLFDTRRIVNISADNQLIDVILDSLFTGTDVKYSIFDRKIILAPDYLKKENNLPVLPQQQTVSGKVTDSQTGEAMTGVAVVIKGTTIGTETDSNGNYSIAVSDMNATLGFSFIGYVNQEIPINGRTTINVSMTSQVQQMGEVVVIGYGTARKKDLTGSLSSVKSDVINVFPNTTVDQALQGRVAGVHVIQNTGKPGSPMQIRIRGTNSIRGDNSPIWIIDGFPGDETMLNPSDIESIEVLKDASATAIYGSRGANGVILVTTKSGQAGPTRVDYQGSYSFQSIRKKMDMMDAQEYMIFNNIQRVNDFGAEYFTQDQIDNAGVGTDWQDIMFRTAPILDQSLTVSGGNAKTKFSVSGSYYDQLGIIISDDGYRRISLRANINHDISKIFSVTYSAILSRIDQNTENVNGGPWGGVPMITETPPTLKPYNADGSYTVIKTAYPFSYDGSYNPVNIAKENTAKTYSNKVAANLAFTITPIEGLSVKISGNVTNSDNRSDGYQTTLYYGSSGNASLSTSQNLMLNSDNIVTYKKTINNNHDFTITGGLTYEQDLYTNLGASASGFLSDNYQTYNIGAASVINAPYSSYSKWTLLSYLGRINYSYKGKYLATASFRADGSSRYSKGNKWGYFPSGALAWRMSDEDFMKDISWISNLKLRVGYGRTGSTAINPYATLSILSTGKTVFNNDQFTYFAPSSIFPGDLKWETTAQTDIGVDLGLLKDRITVTADYYIKNTSDLLNSVQLPRSTGYTSTIMNIGKIQNRGFEILVDANVINSTIRWNLGANLSINRNNVKKLYQGQDITGSQYGAIIAQDYLNLVREGEPLGIFFGYQEDGYTDNGIIKYKDNNGDGSISTADKAIIGNPNPDFIYSLNSTLSYKNFDLSFYIQGTQGNDIFSVSLLKENYYYGIGINMVREVLYDHWTPETPNAKYPKISIASTSLRMSDRFIYDGSYVRLKNIQLAYNIPAEKLNMQWLKNGQIYVSAQNLITITSYPFWDPEVNSGGGGSSINQGIDYFTYPTSKSFTFGLKLGF